MRVWAFVVAIGLSACSFALARIPDERIAPGHLDCPKASPIADTIITSALLGTTAATFIAHGAVNSEATGDAALGAFYILLPAGLIYGASSLFGWNRRARCLRFDREPRDLAAVVRALVERGETAAANGKCADAIKIGDQIRALDEATYNGEYLRDARVIACHADAADVSRDP
jgi:hypothetical protein